LCCLHEGNDLRVAFFFILCVFTLQTATKFADYCNSLVIIDQD